ncbi:MAG: PDDEXK nuclease domain-containing protein [bacterium]
MNNLIKADFYQSIISILSQARSNAYKAINCAMVEAYWHVGRLIVKEEQKGKKRAEYGKHLINELSQRLTRDFGKGFSAQSLWNMRQFYLTFRILSAVQRELNEDETFPSALRRELTWTHYKLLIRIDNKDARLWYMNEAADCNWSTRALERQINSLYYERLLSSQDKKPVIKEADEKTKHLSSPLNEFIKNPYVLEFLNLQERSSYREAELEQALIDKLREFLLELGKGFAFVARQQRITTETKEFYIDLVFYNYYLKCFVLIDLKRGELTHQDLGQMDMYVRMFDDLKRQEDDNPTVGIILCTEKDETIVKYSVLKENKQLFASRYMLYLPKEEELKAELKRERRLIELELAKKEEK